MVVRRGVMAILEEDLIGARVEAEKMNKVARRYNSLTVLILGLVLLSACQPSASNKDSGDSRSAASATPSTESVKLRTAMVLPGKITDKSWNQAGHEGLKRVESEVGFEVAFAEQVPQPDQMQTLADFARRGYPVVIGHGGEFQDAAEQVAARHPETLFLVNNGVTAKGNVGVVGFHARQPAYLVGFVAAKSSRTGKLGYISGQKIKVCEELLEGFRNGAKAANPASEVLVTWINDWDDVAKGKEAATLQIAEGADVLFPTLDNATLGCLQAAKEKQVKAIGIYYDALPDWPDTILQSAVLDIGGAMVETFKQIKEGAREGREFRYGMETPLAVRLGSYHESVPEAVRQEVSQLAEQMVQGKIAP